MSHIEQSMWTLRPDSFPTVAMPQTRLQTKSTEVRTPISVLRQVVSKDGIGGLWRGTAPSAVRIVCCPFTRHPPSRSIKLTRSSKAPGCFLHSVNLWLSAGSSRNPNGLTVRDLRCGERERYGPDRMERQLWNAANDQHGHRPGHDHCNRAGGHREVPSVCR